MRFFGVVGYGIQTEFPGGVWKKVISEFEYYGDVQKSTRRQDSGTEKANADISTGNTISILADEYANDHFFAIEYVVWQGVPWRVPEVTVEAPRLLLRLGEVYNGPRPTPAP